MRLLTVVLAVLLAWPAAVAAGAAPPRPLLWQVSDGDNSIYLLGSFHLLRAGDYPVSADIDAAFADAEQLVFELSPQELAQPDLQQRFLDAARYDDDGSLRRVLPAALYARLARRLEADGGSPDRFDAYEPWFVNLTLMLGVAHEHGFSPEWGLDRQLMMRAAQADKPVSGLETMAEQLHALDAAPMDEQIAGLADFLGQPDGIPAMLDELHRAWREADLRQLDELIRREMRNETPQTYRIVNLERNRAWLPQLRALLDDATADDALVVVGALHLLGDDGLVQMLRGHGYTIDRICSACDPL